MEERHTIKRTSQQRDLILRIVRSDKEHLTADQIYERARAEMPNISKGTVYRNLNLLKNQGKILEIFCGKEAARYDGDLRNHYHVRCVECGKIEDVPHIFPRTNQKEIEKLTGYRIYTHHLEFLGICPECLRNGDKYEKND